MLKPVPTLRRALSLPFGSGLRILLGGQFCRRTPADVLLDHAAVHAATAVVVATVPSAAFLPGHQSLAALFYGLSIPRVAVAPEHGANEPCGVTAIQPIMFEHNNEDRFIRQQLSALAVSVDATQRLVSPASEDHFQRGGLIGYKLPGEFWYGPSR